MYTHTHTLKQHLAIFQYLSLDLLLGSAHSFPPLKMLLSQSQRGECCGKRGTPRKGGRMWGSAKS